MYRLILMGLGLLLLSCVAESKREAPTAVNGVIDLSDWDFERDGPVELGVNGKFIGVMVDGSKGYNGLAGSCGSHLLKFLSSGSAKTIIWRSTNIRFRLATYARKVDLPHAKQAVVDNPPCSICAQKSWVTNVQVTL